MFINKIIMIVVILLLPIHLLSQSNNHEKYVSVNLQVGYLKPQNNSKGQTTYGGFEIRPSIHYKLSGVVTFLFEYNYSRHKIENLDYSSYLNKSILNFGLRIYPKAEESFYLKPAISLPLSDGNDFQPIPGLNLGIGNDFRISNDVDLFTEAEMFLNIMGASTLSFSLSAGVKVKLSP